MVLTSSTISTEKITTSSAGASPQNFIEYWNPSQYSDGTIGAENVVPYIGWIESDVFFSNLLRMKIPEFQNVTRTIFDEMLIENPLASKFSEASSSIKQKVLIQEEKTITLADIVVEHDRRKASGAFDSAASLANRWYRPNLREEDLDATIKNIRNEWQQEIDEIDDN